LVAEAVQLILVAHLLKMGVLAALAVAVAATTEPKVFLLELVVLELLGKEILVAMVKTVALMVN
jgi:hypothetical protein